MSEQSANLSLPYIAASQAQKHVTHNEAIRLLDGIVQLAVKSRDLTAPPASPGHSDRYLVAASATGVWEGWDLNIAYYVDGAWMKLASQPGWLCWIEDEAALMVFDGNEWTAIEGAGSVLQEMELLGLGTTADEQNPFAARLNSALWTASYRNEAGTGDLRYVMNKEGEADTLSLVMQTNWSGRAEIGLAGNDDLAFKVSPNGADWIEALIIDHATGRVAFPVGSPDFREKLSANRTYHVRPDGDNANDGLSQATAFATLQQAIDAALALDANGYDVTISLADGTYGETASMDRAMFDGGTLMIRGNVSAPHSVVLDPGPAANALRVEAAGAKARIEGVKLAGQVGLWARYGAVVFLRGNNVFGACTARHIGADNGAYIEIIGNIDIDGGAAQHFYANENGHILMTGSTVTLTGTPAFANCFASAQLTGILSAYGNSYSGQATGPRYRAAMNGVIFTGGAGETVFPGNAAGIVTSGGQYG